MQRNHTPQGLLPAVKAIIILDDDGQRITSKYFNKADEEPDKQVPPPAPSPASSAHSEAAVDPPDRLRVSSVQQDMPAHHTSTRWCTLTHPPPLC